MADFTVSLMAFEVYGGGSHTYAQLCAVSGDTDVRLTRVLDESGARELLRQDEGGGWVAGDETERFPTRESAVAAAVAWLDENAEPGDRLFTRVGYAAEHAAPIHVVTRPAGDA